MIELVPCCRIAQNLRLIMSMQLSLCLARRHIYEQKICRCCFSLTISSLSEKDLQKMEGRIIDTAAATAAAATVATAASAAAATTASSKDQQEGSATDR